MASKETRAFGASLVTMSDKGFLTANVEGRQGVYKTKLEGHSKMQRYVKVTQGLDCCIAQRDGLNVPNFNFTIPGDAVWKEWNNGDRVTQTTQYIVNIGSTPVEIQLRRRSAADTPLAFNSSAAPVEATAQHAAVKPMVKPAVKAQAKPAVKATAVKATAAKPAPKAATKAEPIKATAAHSAPTAVKTSAGMVTINAALSAVIAQAVADGVKAALEAMASAK
jgi:hypothetical protein